MNDQKIKITFPKEDDGFFDELKKEVYAYFISNNISIYGNKFMYIKIAFLFTIYILIYLLPFIFKLSQNQIFVSYIFLGIWSLFLGVNIGNDAAHNALFKNSKYNTLFMYIFDFLGLSSFNWKRPIVKATYFFKKNIFKISIKDPSWNKNSIYKWHI